jgi:hypothetical protein
MGAFFGFGGGVVGLQKLDFLGRIIAFVVPVAEFALLPAAEAGRGWEVGPPDLVAEFIYRPAAVGEIDSLGREACRLTAASAVHIRTSG